MQEEGKVARKVARTRTMIEVQKDFMFDAAHFLPSYDGLCANMHGHTYKLEVTLRGYRDPVSGMVFDFRELKNLVEEHILQYLDHKCLNRVVVDGFPSNCPTAENIVIWIGERLYSLIYDHPAPVVISKVVLWESPTSCAIWHVVLPREEELWGGSQ